MKCTVLLVCMLYASNVLAIDYEPAVTKAREAALVQTGAQDLINKITVYTQKELEKQSIPVTPLLYCYKTYTNKSLVLKYRDKNLTLEPKSITASIKIHF